MIEFKQASKRYGSIEALKPTTLTISKGERIAVIGPSGCGKSTLLRMVVGLIEPSSGEILVEGQPIEPRTVQLQRRRMGYVIQDGGLFPHLTARQNVLLLSKVLGIDSALSQERMLKHCDLTHFPIDRLDRFPVELSGGQRQRVSLMRAMQTDPEILLLDEPLGALDSIIRSSLQQELKMIFSEVGKTVLLVTHDLVEAVYLCDRIVLLREGEIVQSGSYQELKDQPADPFVTEFIVAQRALVEL